MGNGENPVCPVHPCWVPKTCAGAHGVGVRLPRGDVEARSAAGVEPGLVRLPVVGRHEEVERRDADQYEGGEIRQPVYLLMPGTCGPGFFYRAPRRGPIYCGRL